MDGETPATWAQGLVSGMAHPVVALDHLACLLVLGLWLAPQSAQRLGWVGFLLASLVGCAVCMQFNIDVHVDLVAAASVGVLGVVLASRVTLPTLVFGALVVAVGAVHGLAYGESMLGAPVAAQMGYLLGLLLTQGLLLFAASRWSRAFPPVQSPRWRQVVGVLALTISVGLSVLTSQG